MIRLNNRLHQFIYTVKTGFFSQHLIFMMNKNVDIVSSGSRIQFRLRIYLYVIYFFIFHINLIIFD